jgi:tryprostatin B 6-hydroxylase
MVTISLQATAFVGVILGVTSHLGYFIRGEHHMSGPVILATLFACPTILYTFILRYGDVITSHQAGTLTAVATGSYITALLSSIVVYRLLFHRLGKFPGPLYLRITKWNHTWLLIFKGARNYQRVDEWHAKYGEIVRYVN